MSIESVIGRSSWAPSANASSVQRGVTVRKDEPFPVPHAMTYTMALVAADIVPASKHSLANSLAIVGATLLFVVITVLVSVAVLNWYCKRQPNDEDADRRHRLEQ
jgi:hypothetical protein